MKKIFLIAAILFINLGLNAQSNAEYATFESALVDYNIYKTKAEFNKLVEAANNDNLKDLALLKSIYNKDNLSNADQLFEIIQKIDKRELVLKSNNSKYTPVQFDELNAIKNNLSNFYSKVGLTYVKSDDKLDAIVSYKALKRAKYLNENINIETQLNEAIAKAQTKVYITYDNKKATKSNLKSFKEIVASNGEQDLISFVNNESESDVKLNINISKINQQSYLAQHMRNGKVINDVIHHSNEVLFNNAAGFGQISTSNFSSALLNQFDKILKTNNNINYLEFNNVVSYSANVDLPTKKIVFEDSISDKHLLSSANITSTVWSDIIPTDDRNKQLVLNEIYNSVKKELLIN